MGGIALVHADWSALSVTVTGTDGEGTDTLLAADVGLDGAADAVEVVYYILSWANAVGRPWYGVRTFACTLVESAQLAPLFTCDEEMDWDCDAETARLLGLPSSEASSTTWTSTGALATCGCETSVRRRLAPIPGTGGLVSRSYGIPERTWIGSSTAPEVEALCTEAQQGALAEALSLAAWPRTGRVHAGDSGSILNQWDLYSIGSVTSARELDYYRATLEVLG